MGDVGKTFEQIASVAGSVVEPARQRLETLGLLVADDERWKLRLIPVIVLGCVLAIGLYKINVGLDRGRPVGNLSVLCWITVGVIVFLAVKRHTGAAAEMSHSDCSALTTWGCGRPSSPSRAESRRMICRSR